MLGVAPDWAFQIVRQVGNCTARASTRNVKPLGIDGGRPALAGRRGPLRPGPPMTAPRRTERARGVRSLRAGGRAGPRRAVVALFAREAAINLLRARHRVRVRLPGTRLRTPGRLPGSWPSPPATPSMGRSASGSSTRRAAFLGIVLADGAPASPSGSRGCSTVPGVATVARWYVEATRNTPLLLQLLFWYALSQSLRQKMRAAPCCPGFLCNRGRLPRPHQGRAWRGSACSSPGSSRRAQRRRAGQQTRPSTGWMVAGSDRVRRARLWRAFGVTLDRPVLDGFNFRGGLWITGVRRAGRRTGDEQRRVHRRDRTKRDPLGRARTQSRRRRSACRRGPSCGASSCRRPLVMIPPMTNQHPAGPQESARHRDRLCRSDRDRERHAQPVRPGHRDPPARHGVLPRVRAAIAAAMSMHDGPLGVGGARAPPRVAPALDPHPHGPVDQAGDDGRPRDGARLAQLSRPLVGRRARDLEVPQGRPPRSAGPTMRGGRVLAGHRGADLGDPIRRLSARTPVAAGAACRAGRLLPSWSASRTVCAVCSRSFWSPRPSSSAGRVAGCLARRVMLLGVACLFC